MDLCSFLTVALISVGNEAKKVMWHDGVIVIIMTGTYDKKLHRHGHHQNHTTDF